MKILNELNGIVLVNKEKGYTSHDVVNIIRKILGTRKVGHTGTLDPNAEGILPICVGKSTKVSDMLVNSDKTYTAKIQLGITTDTYDIWGKVLSENSVNVSYQQLSDAVAAFTGEFMQLPPMYSAVKINGKKLYELARKGIEAERKPRRITVYKSEISDFDGNSFKLSVFCSKGTYIRSLCHDIGEKLGCGAAMTELVRTHSSVFDIKESLTLEEIRHTAEEKGPEAVLKPVDSVFGQYEKITVTDIVRQRLLNGAVSRSAENTGVYRVYDVNGVFVGIAEVFESEKGNAIKIVKAFCDR